MDDIAWKTVTEIADRMHRQLDARWTVERAAAMAGYQQHHFAKQFRSIVGEPPAAYCRRLRMERAAYHLTRSDPTLEVARAAGYQSMEAFIRAFRRQFGITPGRFRDGVPPLRAGAPPPGLEAEPTIEEVGPFVAWTVIVPSFDAPSASLFDLLMACPPDGPWQVGGIAQPWGWISSGKREFRYMRRFLGPSHPRVSPPAPLVAWRWPRRLYASFHFEGPQADISAACRWMAESWPATRGGRALDYGPVISLLQDLSPQHATARLYLPVLGEANQSIQV